jgi:hypothetical protein
MSQKSPKQESGDEEVDLWEMVSHVNLGCLSEFYGAAECWFRSQSDHPSDAIEAGSRSNGFDTNREQCLRYLRTSVFLMLCAHLEEMLCLYCKPNECHTERKSGLTRFKPCIKTLLDGRLGDCQAWNFLNDAFKIRNVLLHANGRPALMNGKTRNAIHDIVNRHNDSFYLPEILVPARTKSGIRPKLKKSNDTRVEILPDGLRKLSTHIQQLIHDISPPK